MKAIPHGSGGFLDTDTLFGLARVLPRSPRRYQCMVLINELKMHVLHLDILGSRIKNMILQTHSVCIKTNLDITSGTVKYDRNVDHVVPKYLIMLFYQVHSRKFSKIWCSKGHRAP